MIWASYIYSFGTHNLNICILLVINIGKAALGYTLEVMICFYKYCHFYHERKYLYLNYQSDFLIPVGIMNAGIMILAQLKLCHD